MPAFLEQTAYPFGVLLVKGKVLYGIIDLGTMFTLSLQIEYL
jgi:hypothetical protein